MITESMVYWITRLDSVLRGAEVMVALAIIGTVVAAVIALIEKCDTRGRDDDEDRKLPRLLKVFIAMSVTLLFLATSVRLFMPSAKEMAAIKIIPAVASGKTIEELGSGAGRVVELLVKSLGEDGRSSR